MLERKELLSLNFYKKSAFTGSIGKLCYKIEKKEERFIVSAWEGPLNSFHTPDEKKTLAEFDFNSDGLMEITRWLNGQAENLR